MNTDQETTRFIAGCPYHWVLVDGNLRLARGYGPDDPARPAAEASEAYREWMSR